MAPALNLRLLSVSLTMVASSALSQGIPASYPDVVGVFLAPGFWGLQCWEMLGDSFLHHNIWQVVGGVLVEGTFVLLPKALRRKDELS